MYSLILPFKTPTYPREACIQLSRPPVNPPSVAFPGVTHAYSAMRANSVTSFSSEAAGANINPSVLLPYIRFYHIQIEVSTLFCLPPKLLATAWCVGLTVYTSKIDARHGRIRQNRSSRRLIRSNRCYRLRIMWNQSCLASKSTHFQLKPTLFNIRPRVYLNPSDKFNDEKWTRMNPIIEWNNILST